MPSWTAVKQGDIYCSPGCGRGCTQEEFDDATRRGEALATELGAGWRARVWENLGWHFAAISPSGGIKVHPVRTGLWQAFLGEPDSRGGRWVECGDTPRAAVEVVLETARAEVEALQGLLDVEASS